MSPLSSFNTWFYLSENLSTWIKTTNNDKQQQTTTTNLFIEYNSLVNAVLFLVRKGLYEKRRITFLLRLFIKYNLLDAFGLTLPGLNSVVSLIFRNVSPIRQCLTRIPFAIAIRR